MTSLAGTASHRQPPGIEGARSRGRTRALFAFSLLIFVFLLAVLVSLSWSSVRLPLDEVARVLLGREAERDAWTTIILDVRLPRVITATLVGIALGLAGLQMQAVFRNPLASPYTLGVVSGASLGAALVIIVLPGLTVGLYRDTATASAVAQAISGVGLVIGASLGAGTVLLAMLVVASVVRDMVIVLLLGVVLSALIGALVTVLVFFADPNQTRLFVEWGFGSFHRVRWDDVTLFALAVGIGAVVAALSMKQLNALLMGENYARSMGLNVRRARTLTLTSASILAGAVVAFAGPIAFLGIAIPHITRGIFGSADHRILVPGSALTGASVALGCGLLAEMPNSNLTLPVNAATAIVGGPIAFWVLLRMRRGWGL